MEKILVSALVAALAIVVTEANVCMDDTTCSTNQCCYIRPQFIVVNKRDNCRCPSNHLLHSATVCMDDTACSSSQCCYIRPEFLVVSKRQLLLPQQPLLGGKAKEGVCESYRSAHEQCNPLETMNGHCGCPSGMSCQWVPDPTTTAPIVVPRRPPPHNEPGAYRCAATTVTV